MIAFLIRVSAEPDGQPSGRRVLADWLQLYDLFNDPMPGEWCSDDHKIACWWAAHSPDRMGGLTYTAVGSERFALFAGLPIRWPAGHRPYAESGAEPYLADPANWLGELDGRYCVVRVCDRRLQVTTDPVGLMPVYKTETSGTVWLSNIPALLSCRRIHPGLPSWRYGAFAGLVAAGSSVSGEPARQELDRLTAGVLYEYKVDRRLTVKQSEPPVYDDLFGFQADYSEAARLLQQLIRAYAHLPKRPVVAALTGGRDSRVMGAAMKAAGVTASALTVAFAGERDYPETADVTIARRVAAILQYPHEVVRVSQAAPVYTRLARVLRQLQLAGPGTITVKDATTLDDEPTGGPLRILFEGDYGEIARGGFAVLYGGEGKLGGSIDEVADALFGYIVPPTPEPLVTTDALELIRDWIRQFVDDHLQRGHKLDDMADLIFLHRAGTWRGPVLTTMDFREDPALPFLSPRLWPHMLGQPRHPERCGNFHSAILEELAENLDGLPYETTRASWMFDLGSERLVSAVEHELRHFISLDPISTVQQAIRSVLPRSVDNPVWRVLSRQRVEEFLRRDVVELRGQTRYQLWNLATALCSDPRPIF